MSKPAIDPIAERFAALASRMEAAGRDADAPCPQLDDILARVGAAKELRFFVDGTRNFGHQASTILLMKSLIERTGFAGRATIVYADHGRENLGRTADKLALLLAGADPRRLDRCVLAHGTCSTIVFVPFEDRAQLAGWAEFGFTGGADDMSVDYAAELRCRVFARLQPFLWDDEADRRSDPYYESSRIERVDGAALHLVDAYPPFRGVPFHRPAPPAAWPSEATWSWYCSDQDFDPQLRIRTRNAHALRQARLAAPDVLWWPVYGLQHFPGAASQVFMNCVLAGLAAQAVLQRPLVLVSFTPTDSLPDWDALVAALATDVSRRDASLPATRDAIARLRGAPGARARHAGAIEPDALVDALCERVSGWMAQGVHLTILDGQHAAATGRARDLSREIDAALARPRQRDFVLVSVGTVPFDVFDAMFTSADLPAVVEGQTTAGRITSLGRPFLQILREEHVIRSGYVVPRGRPELAVVAELAHWCGAALRVPRFARAPRAGQADGSRDPLAWLDDVAAFIVGAAASSGPMNEYFVEVGRQFGSDRRDRLALGLIAAREVLVDGGR